MGVSFGDGRCYMIIITILIIIVSSSSSIIIKNRTFSWSNKDISTSDTPELGQMPRNAEPSEPTHSLTRVKEDTRSLDS